jgi:O-antigen ligase
MTAAVSRPDAVPSGWRGARRHRTTRERSLVTWLVPVVVLAVVALVLGTALGVTPLVLVSLAAVTVVLGIAIVAWPDLATLVVLVLVYSNAPVVGAQFHGLPYTLAALVPGLLLVPVAERVVLRREQLVVPPTLPFVVGFLLVEIVSTLVSRDAGAASGELGRVIGEGVLLYLFIVNAVRTLPILRLSIIVLIVVGTLLAGLTAYQEFAHAYDNPFLGFAQISGNGFATATGDLQPRAGGPIGEKNFYAQMLLALVPLAFVLVRTDRLVVRLVSIAAALVIGLGVALTFSRGAAIAAVLLLPAMVALRMIGLRAVLGVVFGALVILALVPNYADRLTTLEGIGSALSPSQVSDPVLAQRANDILAASLAFADHPLVGVGPGLFPTYYREYSVEVAGLPGNLDYAAHSLYAEVASETGILGLITFLGLILTTAVALLRVRRRAARLGRRDLVAYADGFVLVVVVYLATGLFLHISYQRYIWMFLALCAAAVMVLRREVAASDVRAATAALPAVATGRTRADAAAWGGTG